MSPAKTGIMGSRTASLTSNVTLAMPTGRKTGVENSVTAFEGKLSHAYSLAVNTRHPLLVPVCPLSVVVCSEVRSVAVV